MRTTAGPAHPALHLALRLDLRTVLVSAGTCAGLQLALALAVVPALAPMASATDEPVVLGVLLLLATATRVFAGAVGARSQRRRQGTAVRSEPLVGVLLGVGAAWLVLVLLSVPGALGTGAPVLDARTALELPRWLLEAAVGLLVVAPGAPEDEEDAVTRWTRRRR